MKRQNATARAIAHVIRLWNVGECCQILRGAA